MKIKLLITTLMVLFSTQVFAQKASLKTNLVHWGTTTPNLAMEFKLGKKTSLEAYGAWNPWTFSKNKKAKHFLVQPEFRFWFCETFNKAFIGLHAHGGQYNFSKLHLPFGLWHGLRDSRYEGDYYGVGISIGRQWYLGRKWSLETVIGGGYTYATYDRFGCADCDPKLESGHKHYFGITKAAVSLVFYLW